MFGRIREALDPTTPGRKRMGEMTLSSNWIPLGIVGFLFLCFLVAGGPFFLLVWLVGSWLVVRHTRA